MTRAVCALVVVAVAGACLTTYNRYKLTPLPEAPAVEPRPGGCNVDLFEDGDKVTRKVIPLGHILLDWPESKLKEQGPQGAIKTLRAAACENGAFVISGMRALPTADGGMVYEADLGTLAGDDGKPINPKRDHAKKGPAAPPDAGPAAAGG